RLRDVETQYAALRQSQLARFADELDQASSGDAVWARVDGVTQDQLRVVAADLQRRGRRVVVLVGANEGKVALAVATDGSLDATATVRTLAGHVSGGGGGSDRLAVAGGRDPGGIDAVLVAARSL
ncbi:MAG TPA: DHHA1 domain-containing protein, partial [Acidimicrobiales bacterium]|nr:DHHA1 domain-containing protein [Acidimicrobiales bacterium]